ncbi:hypothetical protein KXR64_20505 [Brucella intermedia]|uniref:hypothetical protein n=1 Tax=Brucella TaxID=234 RepID=UPI0011153CDA|nr:hypothetical protein [Brucella intermedia]
MSVHQSSPLAVGVAIAEYGIFRDLAAACFRPCDTLLVIGKPHLLFSSDFFISDDTRFVTGKFAVVVIEPSAPFGVFTFRCGQAAPVSRRALRPELRFSLSFAVSLLPTWK